MYTIIGGDGREYGPVPADQIRQWIAAGRANLQTKAKAVGTDEWKPLSDFPDFGAASALAEPPFAGGPGAPAPFPAAAAPLAVAHFDPIECFSQSWALLRANFWPFIGITIVYWICYAVCMAVVFHFASLPDFNSPQAIIEFFRKVRWPMVIADTLFLTPVMAGYLYYFVRRARGEATNFSDLFAGFVRNYPFLIAAIVLVTIFRYVGVLCLVLPGIYLAVAYSLVPLVMVDRRSGIWAGMELSRRAITHRWWSFFLLLILCFIIMMVGALCFGIGVLIAGPLCSGAIAYGYLSLVP